MPSEDQELLLIAYQHWSKGKNQKVQMAELFMMVSHLVGTVQYLLEHFGLTELPGSGQMVSAQSEINSAVSGDNGIDLIEAERVTDANESGRNRV